MIYNLLLVLGFFSSVEGHFRNGKTLFTETVSGRCDRTSSGGYVFDYNDLGGADLDTVSQIGIALWMRYRPNNPSVPSWNSNTRQYGQVFYITDNEDSLKYRILSLAVKLEGSYNTYQIYQQENPDIVGPNVEKSLGGEQKEMVDNKWMFIWLGFDFYDTSYNMKFFTEDSYESFEEIKESCSKVFSITGCEAGRLPRPYLRRPNMKLHVASHAPSDALGQRGYNFCGDIAGFQWYPGVYNLDPSNLNAMRYGFNVYGRYLNYRMDSFPFGSVVHDFSKERQHATFTDGTVNYQWNQIERALKVTGPTQIKLPQIEFSEQRNPIFNSLGRFSIALWLKATPNIPVFSLLKTVNGISEILALNIEWEASSSTYLINYIQTASFKIRARIQPDRWNHLMIVFQNNHFSQTQLIVDTQALIIYLNDNTPLDVQATGVKPFKRIVDEDLTYIGNMETIPSGGSIFIANYQFHQGARIIYHNEVDDYDSSCMYSFLLDDKRQVCWRCHSGFALYEHVDGSTDCILPENCQDSTEVQMNSHEERRSCYHECAANCKTCDPLVPGVCTSCMNNLVLGVGGTCTCDGVEGYIGDGINMECLSSTRLKSFISGSYLSTTLGDVMTGTGLHSHPLLQEQGNCFFDVLYIQTPSILLSITQISLDLGNSFYVYSSSPNANSFLLTVQAMGSTTISSIEVQYFASSDTRNFQISMIQLSTQSALNDDATTGPRTQSNIIPFGSWDMRYGSPTMVPFLVGWDQLSGSGNFTLQYNITYFANSLDFQTLTDGDTKIGNVYWNYMFIPKYLQHFSIIDKLDKGPLSVSFAPLPEDIRWNQTIFEFKEVQNKASKHMFGMSQIGLSSGTYLKISLYEIKSEKQSKIRYSPIDTSILSSFGAELFTTQANCQSMACRTCGVSPQDCISCMNVAKDIQQQCLNCASDQFIEYTTFTCEKCAEFCVGCQGTKDSCLACPTLANRQENILNKCSCIDIRYYDDGTAICALCDQRCAACKDTSTGCTVCLGSNRNSLSQCDCKNGFYDDTVNDDCKPCLQPCDNCNKDGCLTCLGNKVISSTECVCPASGTPIEGTQICDTCSDVPVVITVAPSLDKVIISFFAGTFVQYASVALDLMSDKDRCSFIFNEKSLGLFGTAPSCLLDATGSHIEVLLGNEPTVLKDDSIIILKKILKKKTCMEEPILNYFFTTVVNPIQFDSPSFKVSTPEFGVGICEMFNVSIVDIKNHGYRTPKSIVWALDMVLLDVSLKEKIQNLISMATTKNELSVTFKKNYLPPYSIFDFTVTYENYLLSKTTVKFTVKTLGAVQIYLNVLTKTQIRHSFKHELIIPTNSYYTRCVNGVQNTFYDSLKVTWSEIERDPPDSLPYISVPVVANTPPSDNYLRITNNTGSYDTTYHLQADLLFIDKNLQNEDVEIRVSRQVSVTVFDMNIGIGTVGGNRLVAVDADFEIEAFAYDPFDTVILQQSDPSIELKWACLTALGRLCFNKQGQELVLLQSSPNQTILANSLLNGQSYNFSIQAKRGIRQAFYFTIVTVLDYEIKPLKIDYPLTIHSQVININQELIFQILQNISEFQFYFSMIYKNVPLDTVKLKVPSMRIKLIDYLPKVMDEDQLIIKILAQSNDQVEALQCIIPLTFNIPPTGAQFTISPTSGIAMDTLFNITITKASDTDFPLEYRLLLYPSKQHYQLDILNGLPINGYVFTNYQISPEFQFLSLPSSRMPNSTTESSCLLVVEVRDAQQGTNNFSTSIVVTRNHRLFLNYIVTLSTLRDKLMAFSTPQHIIGASLEAVYFLQASINMKSSISKDLLDIIDEQVILNMVSQYDKYMRLVETVKDVTIDPSLIQSMKKIMDLYNSFNYQLQISILEAISISEITVALEKNMDNLDKEITNIHTQIPLLFLGLRKDMEMGDQIVQGDLYHTYWQINNSNNIMYIQEVFDQVNSVVKILPVYEQIIELQTKFDSIESYISILTKDQGEEEEAGLGEEEESEEESEEQSEESEAGEEGEEAVQDESSTDQSVVSSKVEVGNKFLEKYQGIQVYLSVDTIEKVLTDKNVDSKLLTEMDNNIQFLHTLPQSIADAQLELLTVNDGPMFFNGSIIEIMVQKVNGKKLLEILIKDLQNVNAINVLQTTNITKDNITTDNITTDNITTDKTGARMLQQNTTESYSITIVTYRFNPHICSQDFVNSTGPAGFDQTFPVYKPIIKDPEGIVEISIFHFSFLQQIDKIPGYNISFQFVIPPAKYGAIKFLQCAQLVTQWSANNSMCLRSLEYSTQEKELRIWCNCPFISDTALIIPYVYVPPAIVAKVQEKTGPPEFGVDTFLTFQFGVILSGMTGFFLLCMGTGAGFDAKRRMTQRIEQEEKERLIAEIRETTRVHRKVRQMQDDLEEELGEDAGEHNRLVPNNIVNFSNASKKVVKIDASTQTAKLDIKGNADMGLADFDLILYLSALIEIFSILLFFDPIAQRPVRFLSLYLKFIVMLLLSGFFFQESNFLISLAITTGLAEVSSVILKVTRSQLVANSGFQVMMGVLLTLGILIVAIQQILDKAFGQQAEVLDKWVAFYQLCLAANILCVEPMLIYFKLIFYPWCLKQTLLGYTTPMIYLLLFLVQQEDLKSFLKI